MKDSFLTITSECTAEIKVNRSKFIASAFPVLNINDTKEISETADAFRKKYYDASHFPFAYRTGTDENNFRYSDDGEPSGSGGKPLLEVIDKYGLTNLILITARYFGGTKLGVGGLRRAFFSAGEECLKNAEAVRKFIMEKVKIEFDYGFINAVMNLIESEKIDLIKNESAETCVLNLEIKISEAEKIKSRIVELTNGGVKFH
ncbi:MAG: YigZ family protein [Bacteroidetes bacterium]|nr:YigZ family protein [Bacteroidota bacterium]